MFIKQFYTNCLAEAAYYIESEGEAAIIDPIRDTADYHQLARERNAVIKYIFETHFHADFISGHLDLAAETGAPIIFGPGAKTGFPALNASDGQEFRLGKITLQVLHTPGHTLESVCFLLKDETHKPSAVFTGDTLFVGDVGRPDLAGDNAGLTQEVLAGMLYDSLQSKISVLSDDIVVYPAHGAGSACGKSIGKETYSTIAEQKAGNYALRAKSREEFIRLVTEGLSAPPAYFFKDATLNKKGYKPLANVLESGARELSKEEVLLLQSQGCLLLDTREPDAFERGFYKGSINIGLSGQFAIWAATLIPLEQALVLVCEPGKETESITRLTRVGFEDIKGYTQGGYSELFGLATDQMFSIEPADLTDILKTDAAIVDVRNPGEFAGGVIENALLMPLGNLIDSQKELNKTQDLVVHCAGGYRSMIACSLLKKEGFVNVRNVHKGMTGIRQAGIPVSVPEVA